MPVACDIGNGESPATKQIVDASMVCQGRGHSDATRPPTRSSSLRRAASITPGTPPLLGLQSPGELPVHYPPGPTRSRSLGPVVPQELPGHSCRPLHGVWSTQGAGGGELGGERDSRLSTPGEIAHFHPVLTPHIAAQGRSLFVTCSSAPPRWLFASTPVVPNEPYLVQRDRVERRPQGLVVAREHRLGHLRNPCPRYGGDKLDDEGDDEGLDEGSDEEEGVGTGGSLRGRNRGAPVGMDLIPLMRHGAALDRQSEPADAEPAGGFGIGAFVF